MVKLVIFDLDDTLYNERDYCISGFGAVARFLAAKYDNLSWAEVFERLCFEYEQNRSGKVFNAFLDEFGIHYDQGLIDQLVECYRNHKPDIKISEDVLSLLGLLKKRYELAILTDGFLPAQRFKVQALGIEGLFDEIVYTEELGRQYWKPSTVGFELICQKLNRIAENCVYVADNPLKDFYAPNKLNFAASIGLTKFEGVYKDKKAPNKEYMPTHIIENLDQLPEILNIL